MQVDQRHPPDVGYEHIVCAVGIGSGPREAVHQAIALCAADASIQFVAGADLLVLAGSAWARPRSATIDPTARRIAVSAPCAVLLSTPKPLLVSRVAAAEHAVPCDVEVGEGMAMAIA